MADFNDLTNNEYQRTLTNADNIRVATATTAQSVDDKLAALETKIEKVRIIFQCALEVVLSNLM